MTKFGTHTYYEKTHKKVSRTHALTPTGSRPFWLELLILAQFPHLILFLTVFSVKYRPLLVRCLIDATQWNSLHCVKTHTTQHNLYLISASDWSKVHVINKILNDELSIIDWSCLSLAVTWSGALPGSLGLMKWVIRQYILLPFYLVSSWGWHWCIITQMRQQLFDWLPVKFGKGINDPLRMNCDDFDDHQGTKSVQYFGFWPNTCQKKIIPSCHSCNLSYANYQHAKHQHVTVVCGIDIHLKVIVPQNSLTEQLACL